MTDDMTCQDEMSDDDDIETQRATIKSTLTEIAAELNSALAVAGLAYPVYLCVPSGGHALATVACPLDPTDEEWARVIGIACEIIRKRIGGIRLRSCALPCAMAGTTMGAADLTVG